MNEHTYRNIVSGIAKGPGPAALRGLLRIASLPYSAAVRIRNRLYDWNLITTHSTQAVVVSVGNLTTGGTGKTPLVIWLANALIRRGLSCAILTRGYRTSGQSLSDEPALLAKSCGGAAVIVDPNRVAGAQKAIQDHHAQVLILDDGFQHRRLKRDLDLVAIDATCPFGFGRILPAGLLREPVRSLRRADAVIITRYDLANDEQINRLEATIRKIRPNAEIFRAVHRHTHARTFQTKSIKTADLAGKKVFVFCGIGNPTAFLRSVESLGSILTGKEIFNDHHVYTQSDLVKITKQATTAGAELILTTEKDWVKAALLIPDKSEIPLLYLTMELEFLTCPDTIIEKIVDLAEVKFGKKPQ
ncbi:MAG TPA: tetraacyldisaccharide 4'-kinase [Anaerohalosphaeraceae bacterium]|nr:tetraacyldisaccharide 4'-kinase [Anaerohalosphaeraceae bacterium]